MKLVSTLSLIALAAAPALSSAATPLVDFEKTWAYGEAVDGQYAANGVTFTNVLGFSNDPDFGAEYYSNAPSMQGVGMAQLDGVVNTSAFMNVEAGVTGGLSLYYSTPEAITGAIKAYSGLNGTGTLLGTFNFSASGIAYDVWTKGVFTFAGTAKSFDLTGTANLAGIDNISAVPESGSIAMVLAGLSVVGMLASRRKQA